MSIRMEQAVSNVGQQIINSGIKIRDVSNAYKALLGARNQLLVAVAGLTAIVGEGDRFDLLRPVMRQRIWDAWQRAQLACDHADDAIVVLTCPLDEQLIVASPDQHTYHPFPPRESATAS